MEKVTESSNSSSSPLKFGGRSIHSDRRAEHHVRDTLCRHPLPIRTPPAPHPNPPPSAPTPPPSPDPGHSGHRRRHRDRPRRLCLHCALRHSPSSYRRRSLQGPSQIQIQIHRVPVTEQVHYVREASLGRILGLATTPCTRVPGSPLSQDRELRRYACPRCKLVPITTPVCTPTDTEFGSRLEFANGNPGSVITVPPVHVPSPMYISPLSPSPSLSFSSSLSLAQSIEPLSSPSPNPACLSRLLSSTFGDTRIVVLPHGPPLHISSTPHDRTPTATVPRAHNHLSTPSPHPPPVSPTRVLRGGESNTHFPQ